MSSTSLPYCDLHTHSTASDGALTPAELVAHAVAHNVQVLALTDHDTLGGLAEAREEAAARGIRFIAGVELSVLCEGKPLHVVGLGIDAACPAMEDVIIRLQAIRRERAIAIGARLERLGVHRAYECACALAGHAQPGRVHFARSLQTSGMVGNIGMAFDRLLKRGKPAYVAASWLAMNEAVSAIRAARGIAVLAHPLRYQLTATWRRRIAGAFREMGGAAIEVVSGMQTAEQTAVAADLAERSRLHASIGSDFHSPEARWSAFGRLPSLPPRLAPVMELLDLQGMSGC